MTALRSYSILPDTYYSVDAEYCILLGSSDLTFEKPCLSRVKILKSFNTKLDSTGVQTFSDIES